MTVVTFKNRSFLISYKKIGVVNGFPNDKSDSSPHYHFKFFVKDVDDAVEFDFYGSSADYNNGKVSLNEEEVLWAFRCFIDDAIMGLSSFEDFCAELGYDVDSLSAYRTHQLCIESLKKTESLGIDEDGLYEIISELVEMGVE